MKDRVRVYSKAMNLLELTQDREGDGVVEGYTILGVKDRMTGSQRAVSGN